MLFIRLHSGLLGAVCCFVSAAAAAPARIGCFRSVLLVRARGPALRLGVCLLRFPAVACALTPIPTVASLSNRSGKKESRKELIGQTFDFQRE